MLKVTISNPPAGMHPEQAFEDEKHLNSWISDQTKSGMIISGKKNKNKLELVIPDGSEKGNAVSCTIVEE